MVSPGESIGSIQGVTRNRGDHRRGRRPLAVRRIGDRAGEGRDRLHRGIEIGDRTRHVLEGVAELAELRVPERVGLGADTGIVHAGDQHVRRHTRRLRQVGRVGRRHHQVVAAVGVGVDPGDLRTVPVVETDRHVGWRILLAEGRGVRVELVTQVVEDHARDVARYRHVGHHPELGGRILRSAQRHPLAVAERARVSRHKARPRQRGSMTGNQLPSSAPLPSLVIMLRYGGTTRGSPTQVAAIACGEGIYSSPKSTFLSSSFISL